MVICQQIFLIFTRMICFRAFHFKKCFKSSLFRSGSEIWIWSYIFWRCWAQFYGVLRLSLCRSHGNAMVICQQICLHEVIFLLNFLLRTMLQHGPFFTLAPKSGFEAAFSGAVAHSSVALCKSVCRWHCNGPSGTTYCTPWLLSKPGSRFSEKAFFEAQPMS